MVRRPQRGREASQRSPHRAHGQQHGIGAGHVVVAALGEEEERERDQVHPGQHAVAAVAQEADQAGDPERRGKGWRR
jgi:hypothetical protein